MGGKKKGDFIMKREEVLKRLESGCGKSELMKEMYLDGMEIKEIAEVMMVRYNFVYNVVSNMCRVDRVELRTNKKVVGESKKDKIIELLNKGMNKAEVSRELCVNYNYVFKVEKDYELSKIK